MDRIQGTDGIRRTVTRQSDPALAGLSPWEAVVERGVITDAFLEGYAFAFAGLLPKGAEVVVAWDPRDPAGAFTGAVVRGLRKGGATAVVLGVAPTPAAPMYMVYRGAAAAMMVTASHNPAGQNGVKIFLAPAGLKLLPADGIRFTAAVEAVDWAALGKSKVVGRELDARREGRDVFKCFHLAPANAWLDAAANPLGDFILVVDAARGSFSGLAAEVLAAFGAAVQEVNADEGDGRVNWRAGVADLEGVATITFEDAAPGGRFDGYPAFAALAALARENAAALKTGEKFLAGVVFDADGDRFFLVVFDATTERFTVLTGDEVAILQAAYIARARGNAVRDYAFINTVESDLGVSAAAAALGFRPILKPVGDKWILTDAWRLAAGITGGDSAFALSETLTPRFARGDLPRVEDIPYAVGCEETGHSITFGELTTVSGAVVPFAAGNGLKAALNCLAAVAQLRKEMSAADLFAHLRAPFTRGYKGNNYVYFTRKEALAAGGDAYAALDRLIPAGIARHAPTLKLERLSFPEEPDLLYWSAGAVGEQDLGVFCRNSGTEDKSCLYVRASSAWARQARHIEEELYPAFYALMKDEADLRSRLELAWLGGGPRPADGEVVRAAELFERVVAPGGLTARGRDCLAALKREGKV